VDLQEKANALAACDVFCLPSLSEILPTVYLEAWTLGKPVIAGLAQGLPELVEGNRSGLCSSQDSVPLGECIADLLRDPLRRHELGENGRELVRREYTVDAVVAKLETLYTSLVARNMGSELQEVAA
jgi:glycosyltransferase involved in cell wall biosynthesis